MNIKRHVDHIRSRLGLPVIALLLLSSSPGVTQQREVATGPHVNFCGTLPPNVTRPGSFDIHPKLPYGTSSCPDLFRVRWVGANHNRVNSLPSIANGVYSATCGKTEMRQIVHRENLDTATGTTQFTLVSDKTSGCGGPVRVTKNGKLADVCFCGAVSADLDKGANYRVYVGCVVKASSSGKPEQCGFHTWTEDKD
jgi:hypothetical protein